MSHDIQRLADYLSHILQAIERIHRYTDDIDEISFSQNDLMQDAVIRNLEIIGEASRNIERKHPDFTAGACRKLWQRSQEAIGAADFQALLTI
jgi:uncharacterized protein with HEPN domain